MDAYELLKKMDYVPGSGTERYDKDELEEFACLPDDNHPKSDEQEFDEPLEFPKSPAFSSERIEYSDLLERFDIEEAKAENVELDVCPPLIEKLEEFLSQEYPDAVLQDEISKIALALQKFESGSLYWITNDDSDLITIELYQQFQSDLEIALGRKLPDFNIKEETDEYCIIKAEAPLTEIISSPVLPVIEDSPTITVDAPTVPYLGDSTEDSIYIMQRTNLEKLMENFGQQIAEKRIKIRPRPRIYDAGSGDGLLFACAEDLDALLDVVAGKRFLVKSVMLCVDKEPRKIRSSTTNYQELGKRGFPVPEVRFLIGDISKCNWKKSRNRRVKIPDASQDIIVCNQVLHWLNHDERVRAMQQFYRLLKPGGLIAISTAADGTATDFLKAYQYAQNEFGEYHHTRNPQGVITEVADPIGCMTRGDLESLVDKSSLRILHSYSVREGVIFPTPSAYVKAVMSYAGENFYGPFDKEVRKNPKFHERFWNTTEFEFLSVLHQQRGQDPDGPYEHFQGSNYLIAMKPSRITTKIHVAR